MPQLLPHLKWIPPKFLFFFETWRKKEKEKGIFFSDERPLWISFPAVKPQGKGQRHCLTHFSFFQFIYCSHFLPGWSDNLGILHDVNCKRIHYYWEKGCRLLRSKSVNMHWNWIFYEIYVYGDQVKAHGGKKYINKLVSHEKFVFSTKGLFFDIDKHLKKMSPITHSLFGHKHDNKNNYFRGQDTLRGGNMM